MHDQAKIGDPAAIAALINQRLETQPVQAAVTRQTDWLNIRLMAETLPNQQRFTAFIYQGIQALQPDGIRHLTISGQSRNPTETPWQVKVALAQPSSASSAPQNRPEERPERTQPAIATVHAAPAQRPVQRPAQRPAQTAIQTAAQVPEAAPLNVRPDVQPAVSPSVPPVTATNWWQHPSTQPYLLLGLAAAFAVVLWQVLGFVLLLILLVVALIPARVAWGRGYAFFNWYIYSFALPFVALFHAMILPQRDRSSGAGELMATLNPLPLPTTRQRPEPSSTPPTATPASAGDLIPVSETKSEATFGAETATKNGAKNFANQILAGVNFAGQSLAHANFAQADLSGANFTGADCSGANFRQAKLGGAVFAQANLTRADFTQATVSWQNSWARLTAGSLPIWAWAVVLMLGIVLFSLSVSLRYGRFAEYALGGTVGVGLLTATVLVLSAQNPRQPNLRRTLTIAIAAIVTVMSLVTLQDAPGLAGSKLGLIILAAVLMLMKEPRPRWARWGTGMGLLGGLATVNTVSLLGLSGTDARSGHLLILMLLVMGFSAAVGRLIAVLSSLWFTQFEQATLTQTNFTRADLSRASFLNARVSDVVWHQTKLVGAVRPNGQRVKK